VENDQAAAGRKISMQTLAPKRDRSLAQSFSAAVSQKFKCQHSRKMIRGYKNVAIGLNL